MFSGFIAKSVLVASVLTAIFSFLFPTLCECLTSVFNLPQTFLSGRIALFYIWKHVMFWVLCFFGTLLPLVFPRGRLAAKGKSVLITGCDTGFGLKAAKQLHATGMHVFAGCLFKDKCGEGAKELLNIPSDRLHVIQLDVTSETQVNRAVLYVKTHLPADQNGLWGIINNAGTSAFGEVEWSSIDLYKNVADVNLWGVVRCTKAFLPLIRRRKGRIVNMASGLARMTAPSRSVYCLPKFAIEGFSDCLRYEMKRWGVKVSIIEPGNYIAGTNIFTKESVKLISDKMWSGMSDEVKEDYGKQLFDARIAEMVTYCSLGMNDLSPVLNAYEDALLSRHPRVRYQAMSAYWSIRSFIFTHFPASVADYLYIYRKM